MANYGIFDALKQIHAKGLLVERPEDVPAVLAEAKRLAAEGHPVVVNAMITDTDFRKGSISM